ncbi:NAD(P)H-binding protein [Paenibacillus glycinis]|uniref:NAD(P)H-binding protein n=1 Tax=Paenibacillus glycinis TaxID=2697035 RepID=A0ABW9XRJ5_9BACL|nr:NAD(P)H-binding protein [Paenibacillus glycinis]NBD24972.1 NAD(P)H-binding protein [Paenibacillus glycinis]
MSRPRELDYAAALHAAMDTFWEHGYTASSYDILSKGTKLKKQSLYGAFGDKKALFHKSLSFEQRGVSGTIQELLSHGTTAAEKLRYWQRHLLASHDKRNIGCLITGRAAVETLLNKNKPVRALVREDDAHAAELRARGVEIAVGDLLDFDSLRRAIEDPFGYPLILRRFLHE